MTIENFHKILQKSKSECEGHELHLQYLWKCNNAKSIFAITGLDFGHILTEPVRGGIIIKNPTEKDPIYFV